MPSRSSQDAPPDHPRSRMAIQVIVVAIAIAFAAYAVIATPFWIEAHGSTYRCIKDPHQLSMGNFSRWMAGFSSVFLIAVVRPLAMRLANRFGISLGGVVRVSLAVVLALVTCEIVLRKPWLGPPPPVVCTVCPDGMPNARYGWQLQPLNTHVWNGPDGNVVTYFQNAEANRARAMDALPDHDRPTILVAGESTALGIGVNYEDTFAAALEKDLGVQVVDAAVFGYAMDQAYLREEDVIKTFTHTVALITTFVPDEVERFEIEWRTSLEAAPDGGIQFRAPMTPWFRDLQLRHLWLELYHGGDNIENDRAIARATVALAKAHGAYPLFVTTDFQAPCLDVKGHSPSLFRTIFDDQKIDRIHVAWPMDLHVHGDPHPGPAGHRLFALAIEKALHDAHVL